MSKASRLKRIAKARYVAFMRELDSVDCGADLLMTIRPYAAQLAREFDEAYSELRKLDSSAPPARGLVNGREL